MDPHVEQINADCEAEEFEDHPDFQHIDPNLLENIEKVHSKSIYRNIEIKCLKTLQENTRSLDVYQRKVVDIGVKYSKDIVKSRKTCSKQPDPIYLMVHGGAGAGKSTVINVLAQWVQKILEKEGKIPYFLIHLHLFFPTSFALNFPKFLLQFPSIMPAISYNNFPKFSPNFPQFPTISNKFPTFFFHRQTKLLFSKKYI